MSCRRIIEALEQKLTEGQVMREKGKKFGLRIKIVFFVTILAIVTYTMSGVFINIVQPQFFPNCEPFWFAVMTYGMGIFWSGVLAAIQYDFNETFAKT